MSHSQMMISIIIPLYNEEQTIGNVIERVQTVMKQIGLKYEIIVVDDHSFDNSLVVAKRYPVRLYSLIVHVGKGGGLRAGFTKAKGDVIVTIDSDGSHLPEELPGLLCPVLNNQADLVIGSRYLCQKNAVAKKLNMFGVKVFNSIIQMFTGVRVTDSQSGYRVMKREILDVQHLKSCGYEIETEMLVKTAKSRYRVFEVPISFEQRTYGVSGIDYLHDVFRIFVAIISAWLRKV
ncbi:MAG: glycosyltransferase family 2 protein [Nitrososphaerota archaeon]|jgi:glycosyltransferase involved in cell wall biosynthesis|nr:glycosyltransferase family 2 protein [Nitrososphaerota archaeon]